MRFPAVDITAELWYDGFGGLRRWYRIACPAGEIEAIYNRYTGSRHRREIRSPPGLVGKLSDIIMCLRAIIRLLLVDRIVYTIQSLLAVSPYEC